MYAGEDVGQNIGQVDARLHLLALLEGMVRAGKSCQVIEIVIFNKMTESFYFF